MKKAIVIGGSLGGLLAANLLHARGWDVRVYERVGEALSERGAGIVTHPELFEAFDRIGISSTAIGVDVPARLTLDREGNRIGGLPHPQTLTAWGRLYALLKDAFPSDRYTAGKQLAAVTQTPHSITARFTDSTSESADLLIGADGIRSTVRAQFAPDVRPQYAGYVAWRGLVEEKDLSQKTRDDIFGYFGFCLPPREQMLGYPVAGARNAMAPGQRRYNFVWYRPADDAELCRLSTDDQGNLYENGIPPPLISKSVLAETRATAARILSPQFAEIVEKTPQLFFQPIFDLESSTLVFGRVVLLGDAAFVARPHCGMGVTKAAGDAMALVDLIDAHGFEAGLQNYSAARVDFGRKIVAHARHLGAYMQAQLRTDHEREMAERYRTPEAVMKETAVPPVFA